MRHRVERSWDGDAGRRTPRLTYANVVSSLALLIAVGGGSAYAASHLITGSQIARGTITAKNIKKHTLLGVDFAAQQLPVGAQGPQGAQGAQGPPGPGGIVAWGIVPGNASFAAQSGFSGPPTNPEPGVFCIPAPPSTGTNVAVAVTADAPYTYVARRPPAACPTSNYFEIVVSQGDFLTSGIAQVNEPFEIVIA